MTTTIATAMTTTSAIARTDMRAWVCLDWDDATQTCLAAEWAETPAAWLSLSVADAQLIGYAVAMLWSVAFGLRMARLALDQIGG